LKDPWKALPWVASISLHATAFFFLAGLLMNAPHGEREPVRVELALSLAREDPPGGATGQPLPRRSARPPVIRPAAVGVPHGEKPRVSPPNDPASGSASAGTYERSPWEQFWAADRPEDTTIGPVERSDGQLGGDMSSRKLIRRRDPTFPTVLSALGQEVECEARITVSPSGGVTRVEITRSSGYTEIDAGVEAALRDYLFSRADGSTDTVGTVRLRFRLEKTD
jgi:TonB family protein